MKEKIRAFSIHLLFSFFLGLLSLYVVFFLWYPSPLVSATGVGKLFLMILGIDLVIGPILTFFVYKKGKKSLKFDLATILFIQIIAISYGLYSVFEGRPVWIIFAVDRFELIRANEVIGKDKNYQPSYFGPKYLSIDIATENSKQQLDMILTETVSHISPTQQIKYYRPFSIINTQFKHQAQSLELLSKYNNIDTITKTLQNYPQADSWVPLKANAQDMVVLMNKQKGEVVKIVDLRPWKD